MIRVCCIWLAVFFMQGAFAASSDDSVRQALIAAAGSEGVRQISVRTDSGTFQVWTKKVGDNPSIKILILHGGPAFTHEAYRIFDQFFPEQGYEYYYYDQLGSYYSDQPQDDRLWTLPRFVDEVEQVRVALGLDASNFILYGHSWGGLLAMEYALTHQQHMKAMVVSNMVSDIPGYAKYAEEVLAPQLPGDVLSEVRALEAAGDYANPLYAELLNAHFYPEHILRAPLLQWPADVVAALEHINHDVYVPMQGPSEFGTSGRLENWSRSADLKNIEVPVLVIGAQHDTMNPAHMRWMSGQFPKGQYLHCPNGSHMAMYDDQAIYMKGLIGFLNQFR